MGDYGITSLTAMRGAFPMKPDPRDCFPDLKYLLYPCLRHICACSMAHRTPGQTVGKLYLVLRQQSYMLYTTSLYPQRTPSPGDVLIYPLQADAATRKTINNAFAVQYKKRHDKNTMDQALIERF